MKLISLNTWGGRAGKESLLDFFARHRDVDVFCLQEIFKGGGSEPMELAEDVRDKEYNIFSLIDEQLAEHAGFFRPNLKDYYGLAIFVRKNTVLLEEGELFVYQDRTYVPTGNLGNHARNIQYVTLETELGIRTIINLHGIWNGKGKGDSEDRLLQSENILNFTQSLANPFVLCGDFNLAPDTESIKKFEDAGLRNLISTYGITSTRSHHYTRENKYADYCFVSDGIEVKDFNVLDEPVSDHLPLYLEYT